MSVASGRFAAGFAGGEEKQSATAPREDDVPAEPFLEISDEASFVPRNNSPRNVFETLGKENDLPGPL
jgi:hypothetical protein